MAQEQHQSISGRRRQLERAGNREEREEDAHDALFCVELDFLEDEHVVVEHLLGGEGVVQAILFMLIDFSLDGQVERVAVLLGFEGDHLAVDDEGQELFEGDAVVLDLGEKDLVGLRGVVLLG